jgi:hypothetical protein
MRINVYQSITSNLEFKLNTKYCFDFEDIVIVRDINSINDPHQLWNLTGQLFANILDNFNNL